MPVDYGKIYPELNGYFIKPLLVTPPMCTLKELKDGTYTIYDLEMMHQIIELRSHLNTPAKEETPTKYGIGGQPA